MEIKGHSIPCRGLLFDKDGTLLHFMALWGGWADYILRDMEQRLAVMGAGFTVPVEKVLGTIHNPQGRVRSYDLKGPLAMATAEETNGLLAWQLYAAGVPWNEAILQVQQITNQAMFEIRSQKPAFPMPGLQNLLDACRDGGIPVAVVTSDTTDSANEHLDWMGLSSYFHAVIGRDGVKNGKPHPEMVLHACAKMGIRPEEAVVIGDSNGDMQMAKQAGCRLAVGLYQEEGPAEHLIDADLVISDYNEITIKA
nr:HAD family hydrolase [Paenibacillus lemnae]